MFANTRKLKRARARLNMKREGINHVNKRISVIDVHTGKPVTYPSYFSENWRQYANNAPKRP